MRYRKLSPTGDYTFGPQAQFLADSPETVAQAVLTKLRLVAGEWFLDKREGLNLSLILGKHTQRTRDVEVKRRILETPGVTSIARYRSTVEGRGFRVTATINTAYGQANIDEVF